LRLLASGASLVLAGLFRVEGFGVLACCMATLVVAYVRSARPYRLAARAGALTLMLAFVLALGAVLLLGVQARTGRWHFARLDNLNKGYSLGTRVTRAADPLQVSKAEMFLPDGRIDVDALQRVNFMKLAKRRRGALYAAEIADGIWRATHGVGLIGCAVGIWYLVRRRALQPDDPLVVVGVLLVAGCGAVFARYTANTYYFSARHALSVVVPLAVVFGAPLAWQAQWSPRWRVLVRAAYYLGFFILAVAAVLPRDRERVPLKTCGLALRAAQPALTAVIAPPDLFLVSYYAQRRHVVLPAAATNSVALRQMVATDVLLLNVADPAQAALLPLLTTTHAPLPLAVPDSKKYAFRALHRKE
jgi:ABC-type sugar transport system permease subunit